MMQMTLVMFKKVCFVMEFLLCVFMNILILNRNVSVICMLCFYYTYMVS